VFDSEFCYIKCKKEFAIILKEPYGLSWNRIAEDLPANCVSYSTFFDHAGVCYGKLRRVTTRCTEMFQRFFFTGVYDEYQLPYYNMVPNDPKIEEMRKIVAIEKKRPCLPNRWHSHEVGVLEQTRKFEKHIYTLMSAGGVTLVQKYAQERKSTGIAARFLCVLCNLVCYLVRIAC
jgi:hypothetical protein